MGTSLTLFCSLRVSITGGQTIHYSSRPLHKIRKNTKLLLPFNTGTENFPPLEIVAVTRAHPSPIISLYLSMILLLAVTLFYSEYHLAMEYVLQTKSTGLVNSQTIISYLAAFFDTALDLVEISVGCVRRLTCVMNR